jgi:integrase
MARIVGKLKARQVSNAKPRKGRRAVVLGDGGNLYLEATLGAEGNVRRSWLFKFEIGGRRREMGLGPLHTVSLAEARDKARLLRQQLLDDVDPLIEKKKRKQALLAEAAKTVTFRDVAVMYLKAHEGSWKNPKHAGQWPATLATYVYPKIGDMAVKDIDVDDVVRVLEPIWKKIPETASRIRGRVETILGFATVRKFRSGDNPARWRGHLATLFPAKGSVRATQHHPALTYTDVPRVMAELRERKTLSALALEFCVLTAARTGAVALAAWDEFDLKGKVWTIPPKPGRKVKKSFPVPLSSRAVEILCGLKTPDGPFMLSDSAMIKLIKQMRPGTTTHGMRSAFRTWCAEQTNYPNEVCEQALQHTIGSAVEKAYKRTVLLEKRRRLMQQWADYCGKPAPAETKGVVVPMHEAGRA